LTHPVSTAKQDGRTGDEAEFAFDTRTARRTRCSVSLGKIDDEDEEADFVFKSSAV